MVATLQGTTQTQNINNSSITGTEPASSVDGDLLIANLGLASGDSPWSEATIVMPSGWTKYGYVQYSTGTLGVHGSYIARSGTPGLVWSQVNFGADQVTIHISRIDGHQGVPLSVTSSNGSSSTWTPGNVTSLTSDGYLVVAVGATDSGVSFTGAAPTGFTKEGEGAKTEEVYTSQVTGFIISGHFDPITSKQPGTVALGSSTPWGCLAFAVRDAAVSGQTIVVGQATAIDTALVVAHAKALVIGQPIDVETAGAVGVGKVISALHVTEIDTALAILHAKALTIGQVTEVDTALTVTANRAILSLIATEVDAALAVAHSKAVQVGQSVEIDSAITVVPVGGEVAVVSGNMIIPFARRRRR